MVVYTVDMSLGFASTIGAYDTTEYSGLYSKRELLYPVQNGITIQTFDQQLYAIAKQVEWAKQDTFKTHILLLGGFHTMSCFVASIGRLWGDGTVISSPKWYNLTFDISYRHWKIFNIS
jgi:hypothetical protein